MIDLLWRFGLRVAIRLLRVFWFFQRPAPHGAYVAVWWDDHLLLIRNSYRSGEAVPCGAIGRRETAAAAAVRELAEEVGIAASEADLRFVCEIVLPFDFKTDHAQFFELHLRDEPLVRVDNREVIWASFVPAEELCDRPLIPPPARLPRGARAVSHRARAVSHRARAVSHQAKSRQPIGRRASADRAAARDD